MTAPPTRASHTSPGAVTAAARMQRLATNPADFIAPPRVTRKQMKVLDEGQSAAMLRAAEGTDPHIPLLLALGTGMRRGEQLGLCWADVDLDGGTPVVAQALQAAYGKLHLSAI